MAPDPLSCGTVLAIREVTGEPRRHDRTPEWRVETKQEGSLETTEIGRPRARLHLAGSGTAPAEVEMVYQPRATRMVRAILVLGVSWLILPVVFFIPPHIPWVALAFFGGLLVAWRVWQGEFYVSSFKGACPRCGTALALRAGSRVRRTQTLECYGCHRSPELIVDAPAD